MAWHGKYFWGKPLSCPKNSIPRDLPLPFHVTPSLSWATPMRFCLIIYILLFILRNGLTSLQPDLLPSRLQGGDVCHRWTLHSIFLPPGQLFNLTHDVYPLKQFTRSTPRVPCFLWNLVIQPLLCDLQAFHIFVELDLMSCHSQMPQCCLPWHFLDRLGEKLPWTIWCSKPFTVRRCSSFRTDCTFCEKLLCYAC